MFVDLFVYGSLLDPKRREETFGRPLSYSEPDSISGYDVDGSQPYPSLFKKSGSIVHGVVVLIHERELNLLDEHVPTEHERRQITLMSGRNAWVLSKKEPINNDITEDKVMYNVLRQIANKQAITATPDDEYIRALVTIGMVKDGWDKELTQFGIYMMNQLPNKLDRW